MKNIIIKLFAVVVLFSIVYLVLPYSVQMGLKHTFADVDDYKIFSNHTISKSTQPEVWQRWMKTTIKKYLPLIY